MGGCFDLRPGKVKDVGGFCVLPAPKIEDGWGFLRSSDPEDRRPPPSSKNPFLFSKSQPPRHLSDLQLILRGRRSKMGGSSIFGAEDRRWKMGRVLRSSAPKIEDEGVLRSSEPEDRRTPPPSSICDLLPRRSKKPPIFVLRPRRSKIPPIFDRRSRRLGRRSSSAPWWVYPRDHGRSPCKACPGIFMQGISGKKFSRDCQPFVIFLSSLLTCRIQNPDIPQAGRGGPAHRGWRGGAGQDRMPTGRFAQKTTVPLALLNVENNCFERLSGSTNKRNPMYTDGGAKPAVNQQLISG